jgi:hypothetical protein
MHSIVFDIGGSLAAARQVLDLSIADAERLTCIRARYLTALEAGDWDRLPGRTYARAFLRTYATALDLDASRFVDAFEEAVPEPVEESLPEQLPHRRAPHLLRPALTVGALVAVVAVAAWSSVSNSPRTPVSAPATPVTTQTHRQTVPSAGGVLGAERTIAKPRATQTELVIRATRGKCWLLVRRGGPAGPVLYEQTLPEGRSVRFAAPRVWVRLGAPGRVDVSRGARAVVGLSGLTPTNIVA